MLVLAAFHFTEVGKLGWRERPRDQSADAVIETGFHEVTVAEIAARADVSERTFFRHFPTKEDVLFSDGDYLLGEIISAIRNAPAAATPSELVGAAMTRLTDLFEPNRAKHRQRSSIIESEPALRERDLLKQSVWAAAIVAELQTRKIEPVRAAALAGAATAGFRAAFNDWIRTKSKQTLADRVDVVLQQLASDLRSRA